MRQTLLKSGGAKRSPETGESGKAIGVCMMDADVKRGEVRDRCC